MTGVDTKCVKQGDKNSVGCLEILSFNIWNHEISVPGNLDFSMSFNLTKKLPNDLQYTTKIERQVGNLWIGLPCLSGFGKCDNKLFCDLIQYGCKTNSFIRPSKQISEKPCSCDLDPAIYVLEHTVIDLKYKKRAKLIKLLTPGNYRFTLKIFEKKNKKNVQACILASLTLT